MVAQPPLPGTDRQPIKKTEWTHSLIAHFSQSLGVNCTYCHNIRSFTDWDQSTPHRMTAWYDLRMVRDLNIDYLNPLHTVFPPFGLASRSAWCGGRFAESELRDLSQRGLQASVWRRTSPN